jgi:Ca2+-transporting ATPase
MVFASLSFAQLGHIMAIKSERQSIFSRDLFSNLPLLFTVLLTFALQFAVIYTPIGNQLLKTQPLTAEQLLVCLGSSMLVLLGVEVEKRVRKK